MLKQIAISVLLVLFAISSALAEDSGYKVEGEWFGGTFRDKEYIVAEADESNGIITTKNGEIKYYPDGTMQDNSEVKDCYFYSNSSIILLYCYVAENRLTGESELWGDLLWKNAEGFYCVYRGIEMYGPILLANERIIQKDGSANGADDNRMEYLHVDNKLYLIFDEMYEGGVIFPMGDGAFILDYDNDIREESMRLKKRTIFVRTSALK